MKILKCKECNCIWNIPVVDYSAKYEHYCHWNNMKNFNGIGGTIPIGKTGSIGTDGKYITSKEYRTSPQWCPLRTKKSE